MPPQAARPANPPAPELPAGARLFTQSQESSLSVSQQGSAQTLDFVETSEATLKTRINSHGELELEHRTGNHVGAGALQISSDGSSKVGVQTNQTTTFYIKDDGSTETAMELQGGGRVIVDEDGNISFDYSILNQPLKPKNK